MFIKRLFNFLVMIAIGAAGGLAYGWLINPVEYNNTAPASLRSDYKADYVLMVAEIYEADNDLPGAIERLSLFSPTSPALQVTEGLLTAQRIGYAEDDLAVMQALSAVIGIPQTTGAPEDTP